jgi:hypothetical protein
VKKFHVGRPRATSKLVDRNILRISRAHLTMTSADILREISTPAGPNTSKYTVERRFEPQDCRRAVGMPSSEEAT